MGDLTMIESGHKRTWAVLETLGNFKRASAERKRVLRQRAALVELGVHALRQPSLSGLLNEAARLAAEGLDTPMAKILERRPRESKLLVVAGWGLKPGIVGHARTEDQPSDPPGECIALNRPVIVPDVRKRKDYHLPPIFPENGVVASANVPIISAEGPYGVLEVDTRERRTFDALDVSYLTAIASIIAEGVERLRRDEILETTVNARTVLLREQQHRTRNNFMTLQALLLRHAKEASTENSRQRFHAVERRVFALASVFNHLLGVDLSGDIDLNGYLSDLCDSVRQFYGLDQRNIQLVFSAGDPLVLSVETCTALGTVVNELIANAVEHAFGPAGGTITVCLRDDGGRRNLIVEDNGRGFEEGENESTGLQVVQRLVAQVGGSLTLRSKPGDSTWVIALS
jgi:two-component system, sensor histidine kinase PdtaS